jgi:hypothetical protein
VTKEGSLGKPGLPFRSVLKLRDVLSKRKEKSKRGALQSQTGIGISRKLEAFKGTETHK